jgi:hypothetical protein
MAFVQQHGLSLSPFFECSIIEQRSDNLLHAVRTKGTVQSVTNCPCVGPGVWKESCVL